MRRAVTLACVALACALALASGRAAAPPPARQSANAAEQRPASVAIVYDTSAMPGYGRAWEFNRPKKRIFAALTEFIERAHPQNEYFVVSFDMAEHVLLAGETEQKSALRVIENLSKVEQQGATALYDACLLALEQIARGRHERRAIILMSDGFDTVSKRGLKEVTDALADARVPLYAVNINKPPKKLPGPDTYAKGDEVLRQLAAASGGELLRLTRDEEKTVVFEAIAARLRDGATARPR